MGVDASYLYGYGAEIGDIEWNLEYLQEKYKDVLAEKTKDSYSFTWGDFIRHLKCSIEEEDYDYRTEYLYEIDHLLDVNQVDDSTFITFDHRHISKLYPETKLNELDDVAKLYAKELGIKNVENIKWVEFGYFS